MTDEERERVIAEAKAHLDGTWTPERFPPRAAPEPSPPVAENAQLEPAARASNDWNDWLDRRLDARLQQERELWIESVGEVVARLRAERDGEQSAEINAEFARIWKSLTDAHKAIVGIQRERLERTLHNELDPTKVKMN
jgi:hypothetical protein